MVITLPDAGTLKHTVNIVTEPSSVCQSKLTVFVQSDELALSPAVPVQSSVLVQQAGREWLQSS